MSSAQMADKGMRFREYYASLFFNWAFLFTELGYEQVDGCSHLVYELSAYILSN